MGSKLQRQNQHLRRLTMKVARHEKRGLNTDGLKREIARMEGAERKAHATGRDVDPRYGKRKVEEQD